MFCILWVIFQSLAVLVEGGLTSASAEALAKAGGKNNGGAAGNNANAGAQNGVPLNGQAIVAQLVPLGGSLFLQQAGNQVGQPHVQQLIPFGAVQQGVGPQGQVGQPVQGGPFTFFAVLPQGGAIGNPQNALLTPGQAQLISVAGLNNQQQPAPGAAVSRLRFQRSAAARFRATQAPSTRVMASEEEEDEEEDEEEEGSGINRKWKQQY